MTYLLYLLSHEHDLAVTFQSGSLEKYLALEHLSGTVHSCVLSIRSLCKLLDLSRDVTAFAVCAPRVHLTTLFACLTSFLEWEVQVILLFKYL